MSDDFDISSAKPVDFDLGSAAPIGSSGPPKTGMAALEQLQPTAAPTPSTLSEGNPVTGAAGAAVGMGQGLGASLVGNLYGLAKRIGGSSPKEAEDAAAELISRWSRQPSTETEKNYTQTLGNTLGTLPPVLGEGLGSVTPLAGAAKTNALGAVAKAVAPTEQAVALARKAQNFGMDLRPDMLYNNKFMKMFGEVMEHVPLSGSGREARQTAFNKALIKQIGGDPAAEKLTPDVYAEAMNTNGKTIGDMAERTPFLVDDKLRSSLAGFSNNLMKATPANQETVMSYLRDLGSKNENGVIPGGAVRELNSALGEQVRSTTDMDLRRHLSNLQAVIMDQLTRQMSKPDRKAFLDARTQYAKGMTMEPLVAKATGTEGDISPALTMGEVSKGGGKRRLARGTSGDMGDIAAIGQRFLKEPGSSNTTERAAVYGLLGGGAGIGAAVVPHVAGPAAAAVYGLANLYNRAGPALSRAIVGKEAPVGGLSIVHPQVQSALGSSLSAVPRIAGPLSSRAFPPMTRSPQVTRLLQAQEED